MNIKRTGVAVLKIRVFRKDAVGVDALDLARLLADAGCVEVDENGYPLDKDNEDLDKPADELDTAELGDDESVEGDGDEDGEPQHVEEDDVTLIVILTPECVEDPTLEEEVGRAVGSGGRAVGIWPPECEAGALPPILGKIGSGVVTWDPEALADVLADVETVWETPAGEPRTAPKTKRNKC
ncbi:hypothetical protein [Shinella sp.]|uniref:hypothetical protein n=1 Tax=Shinella sp. TaxID=1870904 RepID=UPI0028A18D80|nr:hypothetical protein [Shinella sp.]